MKSAAVKGRIRVVGFAGYEDGLMHLRWWSFDGGGIAPNLSASGPDDPICCGWTFRELYTIANGNGPDVLPVREVSPLQDASGS